MSDLPPELTDTEVSSPDLSDSGEVEQPTCSCAVCTVRTEMISLLEEMEALQRRLLALLDEQIQVKKHYISCRQCRSCSKPDRLMQAWARAALTDDSST